MGFDVALRYLEQHPGPHTVSEIAEGSGIEIRNISMGYNLHAYLLRWSRTGWIERYDKPRPGGGRPIPLYAWRGDE